MMERAILSKHVLMTCLNQVLILRYLICMEFKLVLNVVMKKALSLFAKEQT